MRDDRGHRAHGTTGLVPGLTVVAIGALLLLGNLNIIRVNSVLALWPAILIAAGVTRLMDAERPNRTTTGIVLVAVGAIFLADNIGLFAWSLWQFWPLILIAAGIAMLLDRGGFNPAGWLRVSPNVRVPKADAIAIFGGFKRRVVSDDYRGASYVAIFGGGEIDLRRAQIRDEPAQIEVTALFGGFELRVPPNWIVVNEVTGIFGGTGDETLQPLPEAPGVRRLIVRGVAIFGGIGIKN